MRKYLFLLGILLVGCLVWTTDLATGEQIKPKRGGTLTVGLIADFANLDAYSRSWINFPFAQNLYNQLMRYDHQLKLHPELAESWKIAPDWKKITLYLRKGVKFHNGREFTSKDVAANLARATDPKTGLHQYSATRAIDRWETPDDYTVVIYYKEPDPGMLDALEQLPIIAPESFNALTPQTGAIGTGPFKFVEWIPGDHATFERFKDYWAKDRPYLDKVIFKPFSDVDALVVALESGELDLISDTPLKDVGRLKRAKFVTDYGDPGALWWVMYINVNREPFTDKKVRQAIQWAIDRQTIVDKALYGQGRVSSIVFPETSIAYDAKLDRFYRFDLEKAKSLLAAAGYPKGFTTTIAVSGLETAAIAQIIQADLAKIGIKAKIELYDMSLFYDVLYGAKYDMLIGFGANSNKYPAAVLVNSHYRLEKNPLLKPEGFWPKAYVEAAQAGRTEIDPVKQKQIWRQYTEALLDESWTVQFAWKYCVFTMWPYVKGFDTTVEDQMILENVWLDK